MNTNSYQNTARLARAITWKGSKQTYLTAMLLVDRHLMDDFYRAYAYFRWMDDIIDESNISREERLHFINRQRSLIDQLYAGQSCKGLSPQEQILAELIHHDCKQHSDLQSFIRNMFAIIEFDAFRKDGFINAEELDLYLSTLSKSVTDGLLYFIGNGEKRDFNEFRYKAATAAHIVHLLRDTIQDIQDGFFNIPKEYLEAHNIQPWDVHHPNYRSWVKARVELAREFFREGKIYLDQLDVLRCKIAGVWYCARFEKILETIERDNFYLREDYRKLNKFLRLVIMFSLGTNLTLEHLLKNCRRVLSQRLAHFSSIFENPKRWPTRQKEVNESGKIKLKGEI